MTHAPELVLDRPAASNGVPDLLMQQGLTDFDMRATGIDPSSLLTQPAEQAQDPFGLNRASQEQAREERLAGISDIVSHTSPAFGVPEMPHQRLTPTAEQAEIPKLELGNWREAVARQEEEKFLNMARAAAVVAIESSGLFQEKALEQIMYQQQEDIQRDKSYDPHTGKRKSRKSLVADSTR